MRPTTALISALLAVSVLGCAVPNQRSTVDAPDDARLVAHVRELLVSDPACGCERIYVESYRGTVHLSGRVASAAARDRAVALARATRGVIDVVDEVAVR